VLIAKIFRDISTICPRCGTVMDLKEFILDEKLILKALPHTARGPPRKQFEPYSVPNNAISYALFDDKTADADMGFDQTRKYDDVFFNQDLS